MKRARWRRGREVKKNREQKHPIEVKEMNHERRKSYHSTDGVVQYSTVQYSTVQYSTVQYRAAE